MFRLELFKSTVSTEELFNKQLQWFQPTGTECVYCGTRYRQFCYTTVQRTVCWVEHLRHSANRIADARFRKQVMALLGLNVR